MNLAARIESVTPPDEIYLSHAAWLALNKAEIRATYVDEFNLKGISDTAKIYKIDQKQRTRIIKDQVIVFSDLQGYSSFTESHSIEDVEGLLMQLEVLHHQVCEEHGGTVRLIMGDAHFLTFPEAQLALAATERLCNEWDEFRRQKQVLCPIKIGVHKGDIYQFRSFIYGKDINETSRLEDLTRELAHTNDSTALVSGRLKNEVSGSSWANRLRMIDLPEGTSFPKDSPVYELVR